ncbi:T9SS type A sorting domain-containing protein [Aurantibacillus circumpalustris]|uniref:T9SS type A sorting domain-containing protein n=1 Tax=Aurantibacillus circumpalustris TaxID=3036359 RepID=UPI00295B8EAD|nr:T9SS type A sorting domain-containing protein [Aurantibacillus circumpalustris]
MKSLLTLVSIAFTIICFSQAAQSYTTFQGAPLSLYSWQGNKIMLLSSSNTLNPVTMNNWVLKMDTAYDYYALCTGKVPNPNPGVTYINSRSTIAEVASTCGAGCGYLGATGIEMLSSYFTNMYSLIDGQNLYDQVPFYELGRNFWFYDSKLKYQTNDPIVTGYAVFMRFIAMEAAHVQGGPFNSWTFSQFKNNVINLLPTYMANTSLNWANTLGVGQGVPNSSLGATDLFASFCFYLRDNYCGKQWIENVWKYADLRPNAVTTQDAVDNFVIASSQAANSDLSSLFLTWKWPVSNTAIAYLSSLNLGRINSQPNNITINAGSTAQFSISSSEPTAYFQWQLQSGSIFQNINNGGNYSGVNTSNLIFSSVNSSDNNNKYRCLVTIGSCIDTSNIAILQVNNLTGVSKKKIDYSLSVYPNPGSGVFSFELQNSNFEGQFYLYNAFGERVYSTIINSNVTEIDISEKTKGMYFYKLLSGEKLISTGKIFLE